MLQKQTNVKLVSLILIPFYLSFRTDLFQPLHGAVILILMLRNRNKYYDFLCL